MKVKQIYEQYCVPKNLVEHMLRVASFAKIISQNWKGEELDFDSITKTCLFHDIGKPIMFDISKQAKFGMGEKEIGALEELQIRLKRDYGEDEHKATVSICREIGLSNNSVKFANDLEWKYIPRLLKQNNIGSLVPIYCDMRIGPKGVLKLEKRMEELRSRTTADDYKENLENGSALERLIQQNLIINVNSLDDNQVNAVIGGLLDREIIKNS